VFGDCTRRLLLLTENKGQKWPSVHWAWLAEWAPQGKRTHHEWQKSIRIAQGCNHN